MKLRSPLLIVLAALPLAWLWAPLRFATESRMSVHMLLQFPVLFLAGSCLAQCLPRSWHERWARIDGMGLTGTAVAGAVLAYWMIPAALDQALLEARSDLAKYLSWILAGALLKAAWRRVNSEVLLFFVGSVVWMLATAGFLYLDAESRLCVNYRIDEQRFTGIGLIVWAMLLPMASLRRFWRPADPQRLPPG